MSGSRRVLVVSAIAAVALLAIGGPFVVTFADDATPDQKVPTADAASLSIKNFFTTYVDEQGQVRDLSSPSDKKAADLIPLRQSQALLLAVASGDRPRFDLIWRWTKEHQHPHMGNGIQSSSTLEMARALLLAAEKFDQPNLVNEAKAVVGAPMELDTVHVMPSGDINPRAIASIRAATGDIRWQAQLDRQRVQVADQIGTEGKLLPGDSVNDKQYSSDAARTPIRLAESCDFGDRALAARIWRVLSRSVDTRSASVLATDGKVVNDTVGTVNVVASAAAAKAAGDTQQMHDLLNSADAHNTKYPTVEGSAWVALGRVMLTTNWLGTCSP